MRTATRTLFAASLFFVPVPFSMLFVVGWVPLACTVGWFLPGITDGSGFMAAVLAAHVVIDAGILYLMAAAICWLLFGLFPARFATVAVILLLGVEVAASSFPIYVVMGEHDADHLNLRGVWTRFVGVG